MPQNALDKLVRNIGSGNDIKTNYGWSRAVIIIGISDDTGNKSIGDIVTETQDTIDQIALQNNWGTLVQKGVNPTMVRYALG